jgi:hypothetical protein
MGARSSACPSNSTICAAVRPWRSALSRATACPAAVFGPVLAGALRRFAAICSSLATVCPAR